jgi:hypothetical protein
MNEGENDSRHEPKKLWIHGRAFTTAMDMPQSELKENRSFGGTKGEHEW